MIDAQHHVELSGEAFRISETGQSPGYSRRAEPLRPPNSVLVQGSTRQDLFQVRPDVLVWQLSDWSGGEGQIKYDPSSPNRHSLLHNVDPFSQPGKLRPGLELVETDDGTSVVAESVVMGISSAGELWAFPRHRSGVDETQAWKWNPTNEEWDEQAMSGFETDVGVLGDSLDSDSPSFYIGNANSKLYKVSGTTATEMRTDVSASQVKGMNGQTYSISPGTYNSKHIDQASPYNATQILTSSSRSFNLDREHEYTATKGGNRIYVIAVGGEGDTIVREITPFSAAGAAADVEIARFPGYQATSCWWHNGILHLLGHRVGPQLNERPLNYIDPENLTTGTFGLVRPPSLDDFDARPKGSARGVGDTTTAFTVSGEGDHPRVFLLNTIAGGMAQLGELSSVTDTEVSDAVRFVKDIFISTTNESQTDRRIWRMTEGVYTTEDSYFESPAHDFGLSDQKLLSSVVVSCEALPTDWEITVSYAVNDSATFTEAGTVDTVGSTGEKFAISTSSSQKEFRTLRVRAEFVWTGGGTPTTAPILNSIEIRAQVTQLVRMWALTLDLTDDTAGKQQSWAGSKKVTTLLDLTEGDVVEFKDGYKDRNAGQFTTHQVVIDQLSVDLGRPGEGQATVMLREVA